MKTPASPPLPLQLNVNLDVRLIQVNERMVKHKLLVAVVDWVQNCSGNMQVDCWQRLYDDRISVLSSLPTMSQRRACVKNLNVPLVKPVKVMQLSSIQKTE